MGDVFGGTFMLKLVIIFIVIYVSFATIAVSYAKTFRLKNSVVSIIEQQKLDNTSITSYSYKIDEYLTDANYNLRSNASVYNSCESKCSEQASTVKNAEGYIFTNNGACILPIKISDKHYYFRVTLYMVVKIPGFSYVPSFPISSDTEDYSYTYKIKKTTG